MICQLALLSDVCSGQLSVCSAILLALFLVCESVLLYGVSERGCVLGTGQEVYICALFPLVCELESSVCDGGCVSEFRCFLVFLLAVCEALFVSLVCEDVGDSDFYVLFVLVLLLLCEPVLPSGAFPHPEFCGFLVLLLLVCEPVLYFVCGDGGESDSGGFFVPVCEPILYSGVCGFLVLFLLLFVCELLQQSFVCGGGEG